MHALINKASTKLSQLTSATEGQIVAVWVTALAVQRGGDRGGGGRGNVLRRGAGGQKVMIMISEGGWHRHVGRFRWYLHRGIDGGTNAVCALFASTVAASHQSGKSDDGQTIILLRDWYLRYSMD